VTGQLLGALGIGAVVLAALGIYGVLSFVVRARSREIGVRLALGAAPSAIAVMVVRQAIVWAVAGVGAGLAGALLLTRALGSLLYGVSPTDPVTLVGVPLVIMACAFVAALVPARRASRLDPLVALREA